MKRIDEYIEKIYSSFDNRDEETKILKEETKAHLYEEVEELKTQGFTEENAIDKAIENFGQESLVINEMNNILKKNNTFSKVLLKAAIIIYIVGCAFKLINISDDFLNRNNKYIYPSDTSDFVIQYITDKLKDRETIDENLKVALTTSLNNFNAKSDNGLYSVSIGRNEKSQFEYNKEVSKDEIKNDSGSMTSQNEWQIYYKRTDKQRQYDFEKFDEEWNKITRTGPYILNETSNYIFVISWITFCISFIHRTYITNSLSKLYVGVFSVVTLLIILIFSFPYHFNKELMVIITGAFMVLSSVYNKYYFNKRAKLS